MVNCLHFSIENLVSIDFKNPVLLKIPKIHINAIVELMGVTSGGIMDVPKLPFDVGWYNLGVRPGEKGSSVIDGHSGLFNGKPAVFEDLYKLNIGDEVYVQDETGEISRFAVYDFKTYEEKDDTSDVFSSTDGKSHLNLITCEPAWNEIQKKYFKRLVVFTDKLE